MTSEERLLSARDTRDEELKVINRVDIVLSYNENEHAVIEAYTEGKANVMRTPWVVDALEDIAPLRGRKGMSFLGGFRHAPNSEAMLWFVRTVMPRLVSRDADLVLSIYGSHMPDEIKRLASEAVKPVGFVQEISDAFNGHRIFVAPLLSGAGIKGKVLEAMAHGVPCVLSPVAAEGIGVRNGKDCMIAHTADEWVEAILKLQTDGEFWHLISENARTHVRDSYSFASGRLQMRAILEAAELFRFKD